MGVVAGRIEPFVVAGDGEASPCSRRSRATSSSRSRPGMARLCAGAALLFVAAGLVYVFDRPVGSAYWLPAWIGARAPAHPLFGAAGDWLPSFAHAFAFTVFTATAMPARRWRPGLAAALWFVIGAVLEAGQHPMIASVWSAALPAWFARVPVLDHLAAYWRNGTFSPLDLCACCSGCALAAVLIWRIEPVEVSRDLRK